MHSHTVDSIPASVVGTLLLALMAAGLCVVLHTPIPWMLGPLMATAWFTHAGWRTHSAVPLRNAGQMVIGATLGLYFTPAILGVLAAVGWLVALGVAWSLLLGTLFAQWLLRWQGRAWAGPSDELRATAFYSGAIGAASEMTLLSERAGARTELVAASHSLRLMIVAVTLPFALQFGLRLLGSGSEVVVLPGTGQPLSWQGLAILLGAALGGVWLLRRLEQANPWFLGALLASAAVTAAGVQTSSVPPALSNAAQLIIGVSLGVRFKPGFLQLAPRWLAGVAIGTAALMAVSAALAWGLAALTGLQPATLVLALAPGGITEMAVTAKVLQLGVPIVTAFQVSRVLAVLVFTEPLYRRWYSRR